MLRSDLDRIKGIGEKTKDVLLRHFGTVEKIRTAGNHELEKVIGRAKAAIITEYFRN